MNTRTSRSNTNVFFDVTDFQGFDAMHRLQCTVEQVKSVFIVHVGGTRCVSSSTGNIMKIHFRITLTVEFIRGYIFLFLFDV